MTKSMTKRISMPQTFMRLALIVAGVAIYFAVVVTAHAALLNQEPESLGANAYDVQVDTGDVSTDIGDDVSVSTNGNKVNVTDDTVDVDGDGGTVTVDEGAGTTDVTTGSGEQVRVGNDGTVDVNTNGANVHLDPNEEVTNVRTRTSGTEVDTNGANTRVRTGDTGVQTTAGDVSVKGEGLKVRLRNGEVNVETRRALVNFDGEKVAANIKNKDDLSVYANLVDDEYSAVSDVSVKSDNSVHVSYTQPGKVLGIFGVDMGARVEVDEDGNVDIKLPWYSFLATKKGLKEMKQSILAAVKGANTSAQLSVETDQAKVVQTAEKLSVTARAIQGTYSSSVDVNTDEANVDVGTDGSVDVQADGTDVKVDADGSVDIN